jgi:hypothetical protein
MSNMTTYTIPQFKGIDDLQTEFAFHGNSQGDESRTNDVQQFVDAKGWLSFSFGKNINPLDQQAINAESERRRKENIRYIEQLRAEGRYGEKYELSISIQHNPELDEPMQIAEKPLESYRIVFLNTEKTL